MVLLTYRPAFGPIVFEVMVDEATRKYQLIQGYDKRDTMKEMFAEAHKQMDKLVAELINKLVN